MADHDALSGSSRCICDHSARSDHQCLESVLRLVECFQTASSNFGSLSRLSRENVSVRVVGIDERKDSFVHELVVDILTIAEASLFLKAELFEQACGSEIGIGDLSFNAMQVDVFEAELNHRGQGLCHDPFI